MMVPSAIVGSFSEETMRRGARDRRGLRGEEHRRGQGHRAKRCGCTQILASGTSIAKEHMRPGMGETGGKRLADAMIKPTVSPLMIPLVYCHINSFLCGAVEAGGGSDRRFGLTRLLTDTIIACQKD